MLFPSQFLLPGRRLARILRAEQPDVVEVCDKYSLCHLAGVINRGWMAGLPRPVLVGLTCERMDDNVDQHLNLGAPGRRWAARYMRHVYLPQFDSHIAISPTPRTSCARSRRGIRAGSTSCRWGWTPTTSGRRGARRPSARRCWVRVSGDARTRLLLYAGRLSREKNIDLLASMLARVVAADPGHDYRLLVAGSGPLREAFLAHADRLAPGRVHPLGHLDRDGLADVVANVDVFVHPNPREPFGIGPLEAMASGVALVAPDAGGLLTYACGGTAWLRPPAADAFARAVLDVFGDADRRWATVARAVSRARGYAWPRSAARFFRLYDELAGTARRHAATLHPARALRLVPPAVEVVDDS